jgi:hypothetical protein
MRQLQLYSELANVLTGRHIHGSKSLLQSSDLEYLSRRLSRHQRASFVDSDGDASWLCCRTALSLSFRRYLPQESVRTHSGLVHRNIGKFDQTDPED